MKQSHRAVFSILCAALAAGSASGATYVPVRTSASFAIASDCLNIGGFSGDGSGGVYPHGRASAGFAVTDSIGDGFWSDPASPPSSGSFRAEEGTLAQNASDNDGDNILDSEELFHYGTDPDSTDSDDDTLADWDEIFIYGTGPADPDSDDDALGDGVEVTVYGTDPNSGDSDADDLGDAEELLTYGTDPNDADSDDDNLSDGAELNLYGTNPLHEDTEGDGMRDDVELHYGLDPLAGDAGGDADGDGMANGWEAGYSAYLTAGGVDPTVADADDDNDGDAWSNIAEYRYESATGETADPSDAQTGGQAIALEPGWNLIGLSAAGCWYTAPPPGEAERAMIPAAYPGGYVAVTGIHDFLGAMGVADKVEKISGWHPVGGGTNVPVTYENQPLLDSLRYLAGGYGYWVKATVACTWKTAGVPRLKSLGGSRGVNLSEGWNLLGDLWAGVHHSGASPVVGFGTDETGRTAEADLRGYVRDLVSADGDPAPGIVAAIITYDEEFPHVRTYYNNVPEFLQTISYVGPGMGMAMRIDLGSLEADEITMEYPVE